MKRLLVLLLLTARLAGQKCDDPGVTVTADRAGDVIRIFVETSNCLDVTLTFDPKLENMRASQPLPVTIDTAGRRRVEVVTLRPADPAHAWHYSYSYNWRYGGRGGQPDGAAYQLPFEAGAHHKLIQGYRGSFSHQAGSPNEYAHDWDLAEGSIVSAARAGVIVGIRQDSHTGGGGEQFKNCANYVIIRHSDGTYGEYLHLQQGGVYVKLGQTVAAGQAIAFSGNTGFSSRPHLHFAVFRALDGLRRETLPVKFVTKNGDIEDLQQGRTY